MAMQGEKVILHVYDLSQGLARQLSSTFLGKAIEGVWHTGVVVYGHEYYFGGGIQSTPVGLTPYGKPLRVVEMGFTEVSKEIFEDFLHEIHPRYTPETYSLLTHNCNNFSDEVSQFLVGVGIPEYILRLPEEVSNSPMGALIMPMIQQLDTTLKYGGVPQVPQFAGAEPFSSRSQPPAVSPPMNAQPEMKYVSTESKSLFSNGLIPSAVVPASPCSPKYHGEILESHKKNPIISPKTPENNTAVSAPSVQNDPLGKARAKVQEDITMEFSLLMASGSLSASEAAVVATKRVMAKYGLGVGA